MLAKVPKALNARIALGEQVFHCYYFDFYWTKAHEEDAVDAGMTSLGLDCMCVSRMGSFLTGIQDANEAPVVRRWDFYSTSAIVVDSSFPFAKRRV